MRKILFMAIAVGSIAVDQLIKWWAGTALAAMPGGEIQLIEGVLYLTYAENRGAAFGILQGQQWLFFILTPLVMLALLYILLIKKPLVGRMPGIPMALMLGGAAGNLIDRVFRGFVVDMVDVRLIHFAVFNFADACLVCSVIAWLIWMIAQEVKEKKERARGEA